MVTTTKTTPDTPRPSKKRQLSPYPDSESKRRHKRAKNLSFQLSDVVGHVSSKGREDDIRIGEPKSYLEGCEPQSNKEVLQRIRAPLNWHRRNNPNATTANGVPLEDVCTAIDEYLDSGPSNSRYVLTKAGYFKPASSPNTSSKCTYNNAEFSSLSIILGKK